MTLTPDEIKLLLQKSLSGLVSHLKMAPPTRKAELEAAKDAVKFAKKSAVMILLFHNCDKLNIVFIRRSLYVGIHSGQIAFPGGRYEESDNNVENTAFREIEEEIGIKRVEIELIGRLTDIYVPPSNFLISVFVGYLKQKPIYFPDTREVSEVIELDFDELIGSEVIKEKSFFVPSSNETIFAPCYQTSKCDIWGASAMVLSELIELLNPKESSQ